MEGIFVFGGEKGLSWWTVETQAIYRLSDGLSKHWLCVLLGGHSISLWGWLLQMSDIVGRVTVVGIFVEYENRLALLVIQHRNIENLDIIYKCFIDKRF